MTFELRTGLAEDYDNQYWMHRSGDEHALKHMQDPSDVNAMRLERGLEPFDHDELYDIMFGGGLWVMREQDREAVRGAVGYVVARNNRNKRGELDVLDLYVAEPHRGRRIGGTLLGTLITGVPYTQRGPITVANYGQTMRLAGQEYRLPGLHLMTSQAALGDGFDKFMATKVPGDWNGIRQVETEKLYERTCAVYKDGEVVGEIERRRSGKIKIAGEHKIYDDTVFAAMALLNQAQINHR